MYEKPDWGIVLALILALLYLVGSCLVIAGVI